MVVTLDTLLCSYYADRIIHMSEEIETVLIVVLKAIVLTYIIDSVVTFAMSIAILSVINNISNYPSAHPLNTPLWKSS